MQHSGDIALLRRVVVEAFAGSAVQAVGVWSERLASRLKPWHAASFWCGFLSDAVGTDLMRRLAGGFHWSFHSTTRVFALLLMLAHAMWATPVLLRHKERAMLVFHRGSIVVWAVWLVPFGTGMVLGILRAR